MDTCLPNHCHSTSKCQLLFNTRKQSCEECKWAKTDTDSRCRLRSISFNGDGYLVLSKTLSRMEWELKLEFATVSSNGILLYSGINVADINRTDYLKLFLRRGIPAAEISLRKGHKITVYLGDWPENRVNNGEWHTITLKFFERVFF